MDGGGALCCNRPMSARPLPAEGAAAAQPAFSPLYQQIKSLLTRSLSLGEWKPGEALPSEGELALRFKVSQGTVRKALDALSADGVLVRRQGKGTFVATHAEAQVQYRFLRLMPERGRREAMQRRFLELNRLRAGADIARALGGIGRQPQEAVLLVLLGVRGDEGALALAPHEQVLGGQFVDRLAHRALAHLEARGQFGLGRDRLAGLPVAALQATRDQRLHLLVQRAGGRGSGQDIGHAWIVSLIFCLT